MRFVVHLPVQRCGYFSGPQFSAHAPRVPSPSDIFDTCLSVTLSISSTAESRPIRLRNH